ncbi:MAG: GNAT family N-acetyltransferase [Oscillospiraceae bacterium]|nr:GNAT family N-acetyltransferase [Oscillospiraceae bacterium]
MEIVEVKTDKKKYIKLLLLTDEQEDMIDRYLERGTMYVLDDDGVKTECVVVETSSEILEIKNIATDPNYQRKGYGKMLINFIVSKYSEQYAVLRVGTGNSPLTVPFYEKCGFRRSHTIKNFFIDNYDHPIYECGAQLIDMIYLQREL